MELDKVKIDAALVNPKMQEALELYLWIQDQVHSPGIKADIFDSDIFQRRFNRFYRIRRKEKWRKEFYRLFKKSKNDRDVNFINILNALKKETGNVEASFTSKLIATLKPESPVIDSMVLKNLRLTLPDTNKADRIEKVNKIYAEIGSRYALFLKTECGEYLFKRFNEVYPRESKKLTKVKMLDLTLWLTRTNAQIQTTP